MRVLCVGCSHLPRKVPGLGCAGGTAEESQSQGSHLLSYTRKRSEVRLPQVSHRSILSQVGVYLETSLATGGRF